MRYCHGDVKHPKDSLTSGTDLLLAAFRVLDLEEQERALDGMTHLLIERRDGLDSEGHRYLTALRRVAEILGETPAPNDYRRIREELGERGEELPEISRVIRHFGTWRLAKEALALSETTTTRRIEARFRYRKRGKVWRYSSEALAEALNRCAAATGRVPLVAEFEHWRERELELAKERGEELHLPSPTPYRKRWGTWEAALRHHGFDEGAIAGRLEAV